MDDLQQSQMLDEGGACNLFNKSLNKSVYQVIRISHHSGQMQLRMVLNNRAFHRLKLTSEVLSESVQKSLTMLEMIWHMAHLNYSNYLFFF